MQRHLGLGPADAGPFTEKQWRVMGRYAHQLEEREQQRDGALAGLVARLSGDHP